MVSFILSPPENRELLNISDAVTFNPQVLRPRKCVALLSHTKLFLKKVQLINFTSTANDGNKKK